MQSNLVTETKMMPMRLAVLVSGAMLALCNQHSIAGATVDFRTQIAPILARHCLRCHSANNRKGDISLATFADLSSNEYVVSGDAGASYLIELINGVDGQRPAMPKNGAVLSAAQVALIERWIAEGATWPSDAILREPSKADSSWWSLQPLGAVNPPTVDTSPPEWKVNPIDRFVYARLVENHLTPNPPADRRSLIRRATYDLTGLPPTHDEVEAFLHDEDTRAYEKLIDRLLASPQYGERWGRHWLDVVRFGESNGYERNFIINDLWPFRDYVIQSLNEDKRFDQFIKEHIAGDVLGEDQPDVVVGSAFLVAGPFDDVGNQDAAQAAQIRANTIDEMIRATAEAFLGLTIGCARCHDHKFDPILQQDYYSWYATFSAIRHGSREVATAAEKAAHYERLRPLHERRDELEKRRDARLAAILSRAEERADEHEERWTRPSAHPGGTKEVFSTAAAKFVRLVSEGQSNNLEDHRRMDIDEIEIWSAGGKTRNVALAANGAKASGQCRETEVFSGAYGPQLAIDGKTGQRFLGTEGSLTIELAEMTPVHSVLFSTARGEDVPHQPQFAHLAEYRIEISTDGDSWTEVANSHDRQPVHQAHRTYRLRNLEKTDSEKEALTELEEQLFAVNRDIAAIPPLRTVWVGDRVMTDAAGPFHVFLGGDPQRKGGAVIPASLSALSHTLPAYALAGATRESERRLALANWIVHPQNPLTPRVLVNRLWHYHFGAGIVDSPSDFGYGGSRPTHPELLDWLAGQLIAHEWRLKALHKLLMMSQTYQQSSDYREEAARIDSESQWLWRFAPRRLSAEEIRDTLLFTAGKLDTRMGGPGFRLYRFMQDNVATYEPLDKHGPHSYRRAVYHQNARASVLDLMTDFDQPDCAFSTPKRAETTTPLQALTLLNHSFTIDMAKFMAQRIEREAGGQTTDQVSRAFEVCYSRRPTDAEAGSCEVFVSLHGLPALCRVLLNTSELIYLR